MATEAALLRLTFGSLTEYILNHPNISVSLARLWRSCVIAQKRERTASGGRAMLVKAGSGKMRTTIVHDKPGQSWPRHSRRGPLVRPVDG